MPSSPVHAASPHLPDKPPVNASAEDPPALAAEPANMPMVVDAPLPPPVVGVHPESQPDGDSSIAVPVPGIGPEALAVPTTYFVDDVGIGESTSLEPTSPVKRTTTPPCSDKAASAAITLPIRSTEVDRSDNQSNEKAVTPPDSDKALPSAIAFTPLDSDEAVNAAVDLDDTSALPVQSAEVDRSDAQAGLSSAELFSRVDREEDPGEL